MIRFEWRRWRWPPEYTEGPQGWTWSGAFLRITYRRY